MNLQCLDIPCGFYVGASGSVTGFLLLLCVFPSQYLPPLLHTLLFIYHQRYIILANDSVVK